MIYISVYYKFIDHNIPSNIMRLNNYFHTKLCEIIDFYPLNLEILISYLSIKINEIIFILFYLNIII